MTKTCNNRCKKIHSQNLHPKWRAPKFLVGPKKGPTMLKSESSWTLVPLPTSSTKGVRGACWKLWDYIRKRDNVFSYSVLHQNQLTSWLVHIRKNFGCWDKSRVTWTHLTHHDLDSREATTFPHIIFSAFAHGTYIRMAFCLGTPKEKFRNCPSLDSRDFGNS